MTYFPREEWNIPVFNCFEDFVAFSNESLFCEKRRRKNEIQSRNQRRDVVCDVITTIKKYYFSPE